jgi:IMP-specific 5'-nucleotidase
LQAYLGLEPVETLHIGDQFLNTGNDFAARDVSPCIWIINPEETTYILKSILRLAGVQVVEATTKEGDDDDEVTVPSNSDGGKSALEGKPSPIDFEEIERRRQAAKEMDVYTGEMTSQPST